MDHGMEYSTELNPRVYGQMIFSKATKTFNREKNSLFNKWFWDNWTSTCKQMMLDPYFKSYTKIN